jgi:hypothetical protein
LTAAAAAAAVLLTAVPSLLATRASRTCACELQQHSNCQCMAGGDVQFMTAFVVC